MNAADRAARRAYASAAEQGLPEQVEDPATLERVARIVVSALRYRAPQQAGATTADDEQGPCDGAGGAG